jgi:hypothetical protein
MQKFVRNGLTLGVLVLLSWYLLLRMQPLVEVNDITVKTHETEYISPSTFNNLLPNFFVQPVGGGVQTTTVQDYVPQWNNHFHVETLIETTLLIYRRAAIPNDPELSLCTRVIVYPHHGFW